MHLANVNEFRTFFTGLLVALCDLFDRSPPMENEIIAPMTYMMLEDSEHAGREVTEFYIDIDPGDDRVWAEFMAGNQGSGDYIPFESSFNYAKFEQFIHTVVDLTIDPTITYTDEQLQALKAKRYAAFYSDPDDVDSITINIFEVLKADEPATIH